MTWREIYLKAINALPSEWCHEDTRICTIDADRVIAGNPKFPPIIFKDGRWSALAIVDTGTFPLTSDDAETPYPLTLIKESKNGTKES